MSQSEGIKPDTTLSRGQSFKDYGKKLARDVTILLSGYSITLFALHGAMKKNSPKILQYTQSILKSDIVKEGVTEIDRILFKGRYAPLIDISAKFFKDFGNKLTLNFVKGFMSNKKSIAKSFIPVAIIGAIPTMYRIANDYGFDKGFTQKIIDNIYSTMFNKSIVQPVLAPKVEDTSHLDNECAYTEKGKDGS